MSAGTIVLAVALGVGTGLISGMLGVGGGLLMVPGMVLLMAMGQHIAEGTSLLVIIPTALVGAYTHWRNGYVLLGVTALLAAGGIAGAVLGSHIALGISNHTLKLFFVAYLLLMGLRMVLPSRRRAAQAAPMPAKG